VPRRRIETALAGDGIRQIATATGLGAASSSCSYAAVAIAKSLFQKGASAASALAFQIASTNLVWELGLVLWVLIGWQFTLAEYLGGLVMIALMWALLRLFVSRQLEVEIVKARSERTAALRSANRLSNAVRSSRNRGDERDETGYRIQAAEAEDRAEGKASELTNLTCRPLSFGSPGTRGRPDAGYGGWTLRLAPRLRGCGVLTSTAPTGAVGEAAMGQPADWVCYRGNDLPLVMVDRSARPNSAWYIRSETFPAVGPAPFFHTEVHLPPATPLTLGVDLILADGRHNPAELAGRQTA
jgi:hypothetical protein